MERCRSTGCQIQTSDSSISDCLRTSKSIGRARGMGSSDYSFEACDAKAVVSQLTIARDERRFFAGTLVIGRSIILSADRTGNRALPLTLHGEVPGFNGEVVDPACELLRIA